MVCMCLLMNWRPIRCIIGLHLVTSCNKRETDQIVLLFGVKLEMSLDYLNVTFVEEVGVEGEQGGCLQ